MLNDIKTEINTDVQTYIDLLTIQLNGLNQYQYHSHRIDETGEIIEVVLMDYTTNIKLIYIPGRMVCIKFSVYIKLKIDLPPIICSTIEVIAHPDAWKVEQSLFLLQQKGDINV